MAATPTAFQQLTLRRSHATQNYATIRSYIRTHYRPTMPIRLDGESYPQSFLVTNIRFLEVQDESVPERQCLRGTLLYGDSLATFESMTANGNTTFLVSATDRNHRLELPLTMFPNRAENEDAILVPQEMSVVPFSIPNEFVVALLVAIYTHPYHPRGPAGLP